MRLRLVLLVVLLGAAGWVLTRGPARCDLDPSFAAARRELTVPAIGRCAADAEPAPDSGALTQPTANGVLVLNPSSRSFAFQGDSHVWTFTRNGMSMGPADLPADDDDTDPAITELATRARHGLVLLLLGGVVASLTLFAATQEARPSRRRGMRRHPTVLASRPYAVIHQSLPALLASPPSEPVSVPIASQEWTTSRSIPRDDARSRPITAPRWPGDLAALRAPEPTPGPTPDVPFALGPWLLRPLMGSFAAIVIALAGVTQVTGFVARTLDSAEPNGDASAAVAMPTVLDERFVGGPSAWLNDPGGVAAVVSAATAGGYELAVRDPGRFVAVGAPIPAVFRDVVVTAQVRKTAGPAVGAYGLILRSGGDAPLDGRSQRGRYYLFEVGDTGEVALYRRDDERWIELTPRTTSSAVRRGDVENELAARAMGQRLTFLVNGVEVAGVQDATLTEGGVGLFLGGDGNRAIVQRFTVEAPTLRLGAE